MMRGVKKAGLGTVLFIAFLDVLGMSLIVAFLPEITRDAFGASDLAGTALMGVYSLMQLVFVPFWGRLSDRIGRRPVLLISLGAAGVGLAGLGFAIAYSRTIVWLFVMRAFSGAATANVGTITAYIADSTAPEERTKSMGMFGAAFVLGLVVGPILGAALSNILVGGRPGPVACFAGAGLCVMNLGWGFFRLQESLPEGARAKAASGANTLANVRKVLAMQGVARLIVTNTVAAFSVNLVFPVLRYFHIDAFRLERGSSGLLFGSVAFLNALTQGVLMRALAKRWNDVQLARAGIVGQGLACVGFIASARLGVASLFVATAALAVGNALTYCLSAAISKRADPAQLGMIMGANAALATGTGAIAPAISGYVYGAFGYGALFATAAAGMACAVVLVLRFDVPELAAQTASAREPR